MKTKNTFVLMAIVAMCTFFASCEKQEIEEPTIVDSEVLDKGSSSDEEIIVTEVTTASGATEKQFSYSSWLELDVTTRASQRIEITLSNTLSSEMKYVDVSSFVYGSAGETRIERRVSDSYISDESKYVTITDSILVFVVPFDNFDMEYEFYFQTAVYDDGITRDAFPYKYFDESSFKITSDPAMSNYATATENYNVYAQKMFTMPVSIDFNGSSHDVNPIVIKRLLVSSNGLPGVVDCEITDRYAYANVTHSATGIAAVDVRTVVKTSETWSDGGVSEETYNYEPFIALYSSHPLTEESYYLAVQFPKGVSLREDVTATVSLSGDADVSSHDGTNNYYQKVYIDCGEYGEYRVITYSTKDFSSPFVADFYMDLVPTAVNIASQNYVIEDKGYYYIAWMYVTLEFTFDNLDEKITFDTVIAATYQYE